MKKFKAFTLVEVLAVFVIIGIIATIGVNTVKPWDKALKFAYSRIYNSLGLATYNWVISDANPTHRFPADATNLCEGLAYFMNNVEKNCSSFLTNNPQDASFRTEGENAKTPNLILSNGVKLWIGADTEHNNGPYTATIPFQSSGTVSDTVTYYLVYADLSGDRPPNSAVWHSFKPADVVAFAVTNQFVVVPLGYPVVDRRYLSAHVLQPVAGEDDADDDTAVPTDPMTFYEAATYAYGRYLRSQGNALSYQMEFNAKAFPSEPAKSFFTVANCTRFSNSSSCVHNGLTGRNRAEYFSHTPGFNDSFCGINNCGGARDGGANSYCEPICEVKIYDYH